MRAAEEFLVLEGSFDFGQTERLTLRHSFNENEDLPLSLGKFCFPEENLFDAASVSEMQSFVFVITESDGERLYGFCARHIVKGSNKMECLCLLSRWKNGFRVLVRLIEILQIRWIMNRASVMPIVLQLEGLDDLSQDALEGLCFSLTADRNLIIRNRGIEGVRRVRLETLFQTLSPANIVWVVSAMLCERRIIVSSENISILSDCIHGLMNLLLPFQWQHIFVPILPMSMAHYVCAPMPFVVGVQSRIVPRIMQMPMEQVVIVDLDNDLVKMTSSDTGCTEFGYPANLAGKLQRKIHAVLKGSASEVLKRRGTVALTKLKVKNREDFSQVQEEVASFDENGLYAAFVSYYVLLMGHWIRCIRKELSYDSKFHLEEFLKAPVIENPEVFAFLQAMSQTQLFTEFIERHKDATEKSYRHWPYFVQISRGFVDNAEDASLGSIMRDIPTPSTASETSLKNAARITLKVTSNNDEKHSKKRIYQILKCSWDSDFIDKILEIIWWRMEPRNLSGRNWRHGFKALSLLQHMCIHGSDLIIANVYKNRKNLHALLLYLHKDMEIAMNMRRAAQEIIQYLEDMDRLALKRQEMYIVEELEDPAPYYTTNANSYLQGSSEQNTGSKLLDILLEKKRLLRERNGFVMNEKSFHAHFLKYKKYRRKCMKGDAPLFPPFEPIHRSFEPKDMVIKPISTSRSARSKSGKGFSSDEENFSLLELLQDLVTIGPQPEEKEFQSVDLIELISTSEQVSQPNSVREGDEEQELIPDILSMFMAPESTTLDDVDVEDDILSFLNECASPKSQIVDDGDEEDLLGLFS